MGKIIDNRTMYRAGAATVNTAESDRAYRARQYAKYGQQLLKYVGGVAINHIKNSAQELAILKKESEGLFGEYKSAVEKMDGRISSEAEFGIRELKADLKKWQRKAAFALPGSDKKAKAEHEINQIWASLQLTNEQLTWLQEKGQYAKNVSLGRQKDINGNVVNWSDGSNKEQIANSTLLASGNLLNHLTWDKEKGFTLAREINPPAGVENSILTSPPSEPEIEYIRLDEINFALEDSNKIDLYQRKVISTGNNIGLKGYLYDDRDKIGLGDQVASTVDNMSDNDVKSYFFGGTAIDEGDGKLQSSSPAHIYLSNITNDKGELLYEPGSVEWEGAMEVLRSGEFGRGTENRQIVADMIFQQAVAQNEHQYNKHLEEKKKSPANSGGGGGGKKSNGAAVLGGYKTWDQINHLATNVDNKQPLTDFGGTDWEWDNENNVYFTGFEGKRYEKTQKQMLEYNQIGFRYPDRYATNKLDALNVASEESDLEKLQQMGSHLNDVNRNE
jgi:hypothetical protein